jgi:hypothetical protein
MKMKRWPNNDTGIVKKSDHNLPLCQSVHHKSHTEQSGIKPRPLSEKLATDQLTHGTTTFISQYNRFQMEDKHV